MLDQVPPPGPLRAWDITTGRQLRVLDRKSSAGAKQLAIARASRLPEACRGLVVWGGEESDPVIQWEGGGDAGQVHLMPPCKLGLVAPIYSKPTIFFFNNAHALVRYQLL